MKLNTYKNYHICPICNRELPYTRTYFKRKIIHGKEYLHEICKECSDKERYNKEYSNELLLCHFAEDLWLDKSLKVLKYFSFSNM